MDEAGESQVVDGVRSQIAGDLLKVGVRRGGVVLVHSSLKSLADGGILPGGPETLVSGLLESLGPDGTLLMPALSFALVGPAHPVFDVARTPSCVGAVSEHFRTRCGTRRSIHPTHSVCGVGPRAAAMLGEHHLDQTPCGQHSPYRKLRDVGGQIVMIGCTIGPNTSMHGVEELIEPPYLFRPEPVVYRVIRGDGSQMSVTCRAHNFHGYAIHFERVGNLLAGDELRCGRVLQAAAYVIEARAMWRKAEAAIRENPLLFVDRLRGCDHIHR